VAPWWKAFKWFAWHEVFFTHCTHIPSRQAVCDISVPWRLRNLLEIQTYRRSITVYKWVHFEAVCSRCSKEMNTAVFGQQATFVTVAAELNVNITAQDWRFTNQETIKIRWNSRATTANSSFIFFYGIIECENINKISKSPNHTIDRCM